MKSYSDVIKSLGETPSFSYLREEYVKGNLFNIGDSVELKDGSIGEIIDRGPNYVTVIKEGVTSKKWLNEIKETDKSSSKRNQIYKEDFIIKGYRTKNFTRELSEQFSELSKSTKDQFALYNCVVAFDSLLGLSEEIKDFTEAKVIYDKAVKYSNKFNIELNEIEVIGDKLLEYALSENVRFSHADKNKISEIVAIMVGYSGDKTDPADIINESAEIVKHSRFDEDGWKLIGSLFNKATESGIEWNKDIFNKYTQRYMELR